MVFQKKFVHPHMLFFTTLESIIHTQRSVSVLRRDRKIMIRDIMHKMSVGPVAIGGLIHLILTTALK